MAKQVVRYRTCDKCTGEVSAAVTDKVTFNGSRYDIDLCEKHSLELFGAVMKWTDLGTKTGDTGIFDQQREARTVTVDVKPARTAVQAVEVADAEVVEDAAPSAPVTPIRKVMAQVVLATSRLTFGPSQRPARRSRQRALRPHDPAWRAPERALRPHDPSQRASERAFSAHDPMGSTRIRRTRHRHDDYD